MDGAEPIISVQHSNDTEQHDTDAQHHPATVAADYAAVLKICLKRLNTWRIPPNWSAGDWSDEVSAICAAAACEAARVFNPSRGVPWPAFLYQRVMSGVFTRYRQEWAYALHIANDVGTESDASPSENESRLSSEPFLTPEFFHGAIESLSATDRRLVTLLFWRDHTQEQVAQSFGVSQSAISKRKQAILHRLRCRIESAGMTVRTKAMV